MALLGVAYVLLIALVVVNSYVLIPVHVTLILHSFLLIYIGAHKSLDVTEAEEPMSSKDAWMFPVMGSLVLGSLYLVYKLFPKEYVNMLLSGYFLLLGVLAVAATIRPFVGAILARLGLNVERKLVDVDTKVRVLGEIKFSVDVGDLFSVLLSAVYGAWYILGDHWVAKNIMGIAFCIQAIENLNVNSYKNGAIMLCGLFFYDIFWVFGTDVMVTVAKSVDAPIKLLFPRSWATHDTDATFSLLGLGDIVIPGIFIALLLRFDRWQFAGAPGHGSPTDAMLAIKSGARFPKPFFNLNMLFYVLGLVATVVVMVVWDAAQPALLYLVPACLGASLLSALVHGRFKDLARYEEESDEQRSEREEKEKAERAAKDAKQNGTSKEADKQNDAGAGKGDAPSAGSETAEKAVDTATNDSPVEEPVAAASAEPADEDADAGSSEAAAASKKKKKAQGPRRRRRLTSDA